MSGNFKKYCSEAVSVILLTCFLFTSLGFCINISKYCESDEASCCCIQHGNNVNESSSIEKKCCCEIKEMTDQPAMINPGLTESSLKNILHASCLNTGTNLYCSDFEKSPCLIFSLKSPSKEKIHILNSNFRI